MSKPNAIGIDLGTAYSCVAVCKQGKVKILSNSEGKRKTPSYVAFTETERLIGDVAKDLVSSNPTNTVFNIKRSIGRKFDEVVALDGFNHWPFSIVNVNGHPKFEVMYKNEEKTFTPEEITAMILVTMKKTAEENLEERCHHCTRLF